MIVFISQFSEFWKILNFLFFQNDDFGLKISDFGSAQELGEEKVNLTFQSDLKVISSNFSYLIKTKYFLKYQFL